MQTLKRGILIVLEGLDGSGKSLLTKNLHKELAQLYAHVITTKEPGASSIGPKLRELTQHQTTPLAPEAEFLLFAADRAQHFKEIIIPQLHNNALIISDRMNDSSVVYQGYGRGLDISMITNVNDWVMHGRKADLTLYIKIDLMTALGRVKNRNETPTAFELEKVTFLEKVLQGFTELYATRENVITLDGHLSPEQLTAQALKEIIQWIQKNNLSN